ncbi:MAG: class II aldolase/adducin family protein [Pegethrix bostrychoides GSE-TBD4-15B]|jgi:ribulose-5-phosphate 4-epimerase/fuculose-1-phosphate aldolase|uniref:Class II aldolase/adducin family protein n=1 Tax=Pegethrix bostrychoides GSE-TBD4-15B TaxID=2839662 RepID=A0A951PCW2_9CYAN|nr:class II aldolase/adducin family protein [Pegethrix bostrychoides GSE-TBD4-15B]
MLQNIARPGDLPHALPPQPADESSLRLDLAAAYRLIARFKMADLIETHISVRLPGSEHFLINPYGLLFEEITASSLVKVNLQGEVLSDDSIEPTAWQINPAGFVIHSAIYPARPDAGCVLHTHSPYVMAVSALQSGLLPLCQIGLQFYNRVAYHDYEGVSLELDEQERLVNHLGNKKVMLMRNHGLLAVGRTVAEAFHLAYYMEKACEVQIRAQSTGSPLIEPTPAVCEKSARQQESEQLGELQWQALLRLLDREAPSYRQ